MGCYKNIIDSLRLCGNGDDPVDECGQVNCVCHYGDRDPMCRQKIMYDAADAIEELLAENKAIKQSNKDAAMRNKLLCDEISRMKEKVPKWISVEERLPERTNPLHARDIYLVRLEIGYIETLFYEYDNSDRCRPGMSPLIDEGWGETVVPVTHWMPLPAPPKEVE